MKYLRNPLAVLAMLGLALLMAVTADAQTPTLQTPSTPTKSTALERGFRTGYSDGYNIGYKDGTDKTARDYQNKEEYQRADRAFNEVWGTVEDYRDGYQQGFEAGYTSGYDRRPFDSTIPEGISRRGTTDPTTTDPTMSGNPGSTAPANPQDNNTSYPADRAPLHIPRDSVLLVEMKSRLSTDVSQRGDRFQARVIQKGEFEGAIVEGRVTRVKRAGKLKGTSELQLEFETLRMPDGRTTSIHAEVVEVVDMGYENTGTVDDEGGVKGRDSTKDDVTKVGAGAGVGAIIGAIVGGGKGAAIGAAIGGGVGTGAVLSSRGRDIRLEQGQQLKIRTATETRVE